ncbi:hypothetical protein Taro_004209 [Colocasia esculenta]|uniref:BHLH domain-containing protein n=1 Tax=Colocasia esculenta TaxID=4460 RepID=A0A843TPE9_COLES|nr:hypothetical protein [Colocasia esculenta]
MELQGKKQAAGDFLTLFRDPSFPDSRPPSQGFFPKTRDFLQPLERAEASGGGGAGQRTAPAAGRPGPVEHVPPVRSETCGADHVRPVAVKPEWPSCAAAEDGARRAAAAAAKRSAFTLWDEEAAAWPGEGGGDIAGEGTQQQAQQQQQQRWPPPSPFPAARGGANGSFPSFPNSRNQLAQDKRGPMVAASRSARGLVEDDDEGEEDFAKEEKPYPREMPVKIDRSVSNNDDGSGKDQRPSTPRSKHSATEQRRRTKINDRFQILRDLIPHSEQKRDKASFLLEVIEYIQFLQEKVQKYEPSCPEWNQANVKLMPWKNCQPPGVSMVDHSNMTRDHPASAGFIFPADNAILNGPTIMSNNQTVVESDNRGAALTTKSASMPIPVQYPAGAGSGFSQPQLKFISDSESMAAQPHSGWLRSAADASVSTDVLSGHEEMTVDEGASTLSSLYSERLLTTLTEALQNSGVDISQASISVQVNLHRRMTGRRISKNKDQDDPISSNRLHSAFGSSGDESERGSKRHKSDTT